jgi:8-oxo-dGTP diphosphatase
MKHLNVACAIIENDGKILATQRSASMSLPLKWEFPGGKIRDGEQPEECLKREILEELGIDIAVGRALPPITHRYSNFTVTLHSHICKIAGGEIALYEHAASCWLRPEDLPNLDWAEADWVLIENSRKEIHLCFGDLD